MIPFGLFKLLEGGTVSVQVELLTQVSLSRRPSRPKSRLNAAAPSQIACRSVLVEQAPVLPPPLPDLGESAWLDPTSEPIGTSSSPVDSLSFSFPVVHAPDQDWAKRCRTSPAVSKRTTAFRELLTRECANSRRPELTARHSRTAQHDWRSAQRHDDGLLGCLVGSTRQSAHLVCHGGRERGGVAWNDSVSFILECRIMPAVADYGCRAQRLITYPEVVGEKFAYWGMALSGLLGGAMCVVKRNISSTNR